MTARLILTIGVILAGLAAGEVVCWLLFDDDTPNQPEDTTEN